VRLPCPVPDAPSPAVNRFDENDWAGTFDAIGDAVAIVGADGQILCCNAAMAALAGSPRESLVGKPVSQSLPDNGAATTDLVAAALDARQRTTSELTAGDRLFRIAVDPVPGVPGAGPHAARAVLIISDVTAHRRDDEDQRHRAEQLSELARRKDEFLGMLAHELRNPLNAIAAATSLMDRVGAQDERNVRLRTTVRRQTRALARLVDDLLEVSRVTRGKMRLQPERKELGAIVRSAIDHARPTIEARNQHLEVQLPVEPMPINADALRLEQVFVNLLQNASKYSEPGTVVSIACTRSSDDGPRRACIRVRDQGVGIPAEKLEPIFELFFQVDQTLARSLGGLGLGLTIARRLVELHGGTIRAASEGEGRGSEFIVELPLSVEEGSDVAASDDSEPQGDQPPLTIVVIEDNRDARETLHAWLGELGHRVFEAPDGLSGLELARSVCPDVALVDIGLPGIDGYQVARNLRESAECRDAYLVAITGYGRPEDSARAREAGFDLHLVKPIQPEVIARVIRAPRRQAAARSPHGDDGPSGR
jgi:signal transduction histidine kinase/ActR/RegA family two-component response regulator